MRFIVLTIVIGALVLGGIAVYMIRTVRHTPIEKWHVDPMVAPNPPSPNFYRIGPRDGQTAPVDDEAPAYGVTPEELAKAVDDFALRQRDTQRIAGAPGQLWMTYVQRTPRLKFPDYISVKVLQLEDGRSTLSVFSRARFGYGDMGVNRMRVEAWLSALAPLEAADPPQSDVIEDAAPDPDAADPPEDLSEDPPEDPTAPTALSQPDQDDDGSGPPTPVASPPTDRSQETPQSPPRQPSPSRENPSQETIVE